MLLTNHYTYTMAKLCNSLIRYTELKDHGETDGGTLHITQ